MHLAGLSAPRVGSASREDGVSLSILTRTHLQPFSFASREYLRALLVGKEVAFNVTHTVPGVSLLYPMISPNRQQPTDREYGTLQIAPAQAGGPPQDVSNLIVKNGWAKVREHGGEGDEAIRCVNPQCKLRLG
jgi:staphylococcal nuclease domain-containing protein 1